MTLNQVMTLGLLLMIGTLIFSKPAEAAVINATAFNITSDADLNSTAGNIRFVDGKIIAAAGNRSNITTWDYFTDGNWTGNPLWNATNRSTTTTVSNNISVKIANKIINLTTDRGIGGGKTSKALLVLEKNFSVPKSSGIVVSFYMKNGYTVGAGGTPAATLCFVSDPAPFLSNSTSARAGNFCAAPTGTDASEVGISLGSSDNSFVIYEETTSSTYSAGSSFGATHQEFQHVQYWLNWSHHRAIINLTEGGSADSGLRALPSSGMKMDSGSFILAAIDLSSQDTRSVSFTNFTVANATEFGLPFNLTSATLHSAILNSSVNITGIKAINKSLYTDYSHSARLYATSADFRNLSSIIEGKDNVLPNITGVAINGTYSILNLYGAAEITNIYVEWSSPERDVNPPTMSFFLEKSTLTNNVGNTNKFTINATDDSSASNIQSANFTLNTTSGVIDRSFSFVPSQSINTSYSIFVTNENLTIGNYNITNVRACDNSGNCNTTADVTSFPNWAGLAFSVTQVGDSDVGGSGGAGGQSQTVLVLGQGANETVIIDFGRPSLTITVIVAPKQGRESYVIQNIGNKRFDGDVLLSNTLVPYLSSQVCSLISGDCAVQDVSISAGEKALLVIDYAVPREIGNGAEGLLRLEEESSGGVFELPLKISRPPGYGLYVKIADSYLGGDEAKAAIVFVLGLTAGLILLILGIRGGL